MKKLLTFIICLSFSISKSYSSKNNDMIELYIRTLKSHLNSVEKSILNEKEKKKFVNDTIYVICDTYYELPVKIGDYNIKMIQEPYVTKEKPSILAFRLFPPGIEKGDIIIVIGEYTISFNEKEEDFIYNGGQSFSFRYNKLNQKYDLIKTKKLTI
jgi:hypothetical protein